MTSTLLSLPREIRDQIYSYLIPKTSLDRPTNSSKCTFGMSDLSASRARNSYPAISDDLLSFKTNRQLYLETMPLWFQHNEVNIMDRSLSFRNTVRWFKAISAERLSHVRVVNVKHQPTTPDSNTLRVWRDRTGTFQLDAAYRDLNHHKILFKNLGRLQNCRAIC